VGFEVTWDECREIEGALPPGPLRDRLTARDVVAKVLVPTRLAATLNSGVVIAGASMNRAQHVQISSEGCGPDPGELESERT
jgi:hypothetical protein